MKMAFTVVALILSFVVSASAADRKIGNVVAVERSIDNVYQDCVDQLEGKPSSSSNFYSCRFKAKISNADFAPGSQGLIRFSQGQCAVEASLQNSVIFVTFNGTGPKAALAEAKSCLRSALNASDNKDSFKFIVYTVE